MTKKEMKNVILVATLLLLMFNVSANAWVYPEHREIALRVIKNLSPAYRTILDKLWLEAREGNESRLCEIVIDPLQTINPNCLDYASRSAISGDHSCSAENMLEVVLQYDWILEVADINAQLKINLALADKREKRINALRDSDLQLQKADPEYATRAGSNNVHFLLPLHDVDMDIFAYIDSCLDAGGRY